MSDLDLLYESLGKRFAFFGLGVHAFSRSGLEDIPNYHIVCFLPDSDKAALQGRIPVFGIPLAAGVKRNGTSLLRDERVVRYIRRKAKGKTPVIVVYKVSRILEILCKSAGFILASNSDRFVRTFGDKAVFRALGNHVGILVPRAHRVSIKEPERQWPHLEKMLGVPFLLQTTFQAGGKGNKKIGTKKIFVQATRTLLRTYGHEALRERVWALQLMKGSSPSGTGVVTPFGIVFTSLQQQIIDVPKKQGAFGVFCGHDFTYQAPPEVQTQADATFLRVGKYLAEHGYKGVFGLDFLLERSTNKLYALECNPRSLGSFPALFYEQKRTEQPPIILFSIPAFLALTPQEKQLYKNAVAYATLQKPYHQPKQGAHLFVSSHLSKPVLVKQSLRTGLYECKRDGKKQPNCTFVKESSTPLDIINESQFLLCDGVPSAGTKVAKGQRIGHIFIRRRALHASSGRLTFFVRNILTFIQQHISI